jgi:hypothetical protein
LLELSRRSYVRHGDVGAKGRRRQLAGRGGLSLLMGLEASNRRKCRRSPVRGNRHTALANRLPALLMELRETPFAMSLFRVASHAKPNGAKVGGRSEIRTHGGVAPTAVFKTAALSHSAILPSRWRHCGFLSLSVARKTAFAAVLLPEASVSVYCGADRRVNLGRRALYALRAGRGFEAEGDRDARMAERGKRPGCDPRRAGRSGEQARSGL